MKKMFRKLLLLAVGCFSLINLNGPLLSNAHALEAIEAGLEYPVGLGNLGQSFSSNLGVNAALYFDRLIDPKISNFISVGYESFTAMADGKSSLRLFPIVAGLEFPGQVFSDLWVNFGIGAGIAVGYLNVPNTINYNVNAYFDAQIRPGIEWVASDGVSIVGRAPVNFVVGKSSISYVVYDLGVKIKL